MHPLCGALVTIFFLKRDFDIELWILYTLRLLVMVNIFTKLYEITTLTWGNYRLDEAGWMANIHSIKVAHYVELTVSKIRSNQN